MDTSRLIAIVLFAFSGLMLWEAWNKPQTTDPVQVAAATAAAKASEKAANGVPVGAILAPTTGVSATGVPVSSVPSVTAGAVPVAAANIAVASPSLAPQISKRIKVKTDKFDLEFDTLGGDIRVAVLNEHKATKDRARNFPLLQDQENHYFVSQIGVISAPSSELVLPNHLSFWNTANASYDMGTGDKLEVRFENKDIPGLTAIKTYSFTRGKYDVDVTLELVGKTSVADTALVAPIAYFQFMRDDNAPEGENNSSNPFTGVVTFTGPAVYTEAKKFQKIAFTDIEKGKLEFVKEANDGWIAMVQHYFVSAWLPQKEAKREFYATKTSNKRFASGVKLAFAPSPTESQAVSTKLYLGPQEQENLKKLAPGLDLVVDYGWLTVIAYPMFVILSFIHGIIGNWGWAIILLTILIKIVFYPLNQKAGKSMAQMKVLAPKMEALKARFGDDKMKMNQAVMELYKTEKVNPLGGCLPMLVQMPFFLALYWVLLGAVELRNAPWIGWITDLSTPDPFYILPIFMGASMIVQTRMNPAPPDPIQAKVMMAMPIVFSIMFFFFPAGLVLYWAMQNLLGIAQTWNINRLYKPAEVVHKR
jgi:YidC/Oxa1 family membrane protein insertase